jgi:hypothetical protein
MARLASRTGVCVIRIEEQENSLLVVIRTNPDISSPSREFVSAVADVDAAIASVRNFLEHFTTRGTKPRHQ